MDGKYEKLKKVINCGSDVFDPILSDMFTEDEVKLIGTFEKNVFRSDDVADVLAVSIDEARETLEKSWKSGVLERDTDGGYKVLDMYDRLDFFVLGNKKLWGSYPRELTTACDSWYFSEYGKRVETRMGSASKPSEIVLPLEDALDYIDGKPDELYVLPCDCRSILGACDHTKEVCIQTMPNPATERGFGRKITKSEAKEIIKQADAEGLIHSPTTYHFCNCCTDCCYPFRYSKIRDSGKEWPKSFYAAIIDSDSCIGCGECAERCPVNAISVGAVAEVDASVCMGCGVCRVPCPCGAISLEKIREVEFC